MNNTKFKRWYVGTITANVSLLRQQTYTRRRLIQNAQKPGSHSILHEVNQRFFRPQPLTVFSDDINLLETAQAAAAEALSPPFPPLCTSTTTYINQSINSHRINSIAESTVKPSPEHHTNEHDPPQIRGSKGSECMRMRNRACAPKPKTCTGQKETKEASTRQGMARQGGKDGPRERRGESGSSPTRLTWWRRPAEAERRRRRSGGSES